jgi:hypothetical protein
MSEGEKERWTNTGDSGKIVLILEGGTTIKKTTQNAGKLILKIARLTATI